MAQVLVRLKATPTRPPIRHAVRPAISHAQPWLRSTPCPLHPVITESLEELRSTLGHLSLVVVPPEEPIFPRAEERFLEHESVRRAWETALPDTRRVRIRVLDGDRIVATAAFSPGHALATAEPVFLGDVFAGKAEPVVGARLGDFVEGTAAGLGGRWVVATIGDCDDARLEWLRIRGYREVARKRRWQLDLPGAAPDLALSERIARQAAVDVISYSDALARGMPLDLLEDQMRRVHFDILRDLRYAFPIHDWDLETYRRLLLPRGRFHPDATMLALRSDRLVGMTLATTVLPGVAHGLVCGVVGPARGRNVPLALRLRTIAALRDAGYKRFATMNDIDNAPMRRSLRALGFVPEFELIQFAKRTRHPRA